MTLTVGSLFSGIGGLDLGLERAGLEVIWQIEKDPFCRDALRARWPDRVPILTDVRDVDPTSLPRPDVLAGGFPCQDISQAASGWDPPGLEGERSGLWDEFARFIRLLRPAYIIVENVEFLRRRGLHRVLGDLAHLRYDAEWDCFPASAVGAPHRRVRLWLVAYPNDEGESDDPVDAEVAVLSRSGPPVRRWPDPPSGLRVDDGVPSRVERNHALGNAVVPDVAEWIGRQIMEHEHGKRIRRATHPGPTGVPSSVGRDQLG